MKKFEASETFLGKWINGDVSDQDQKLFEETEDFALYQRIISESSEFTRETLDKEAIYKKITAEIQQRNHKKVRFLNPRITWAIAASVALLIGFFMFNTSTKEFNTNFGEQLAITLPDNSEVILNAKSSISYDQKQWKNIRKVTLKGEAFFKVAKKKETFLITTNQGEVTVLGTQFSVLEDDDFFQVECFEGKVKVISKDQVAYLTKGMIFKRIKNEVVNSVNNENNTIPYWMEGESFFNAVPLEVVVERLQKQYNFKIKGTLHQKQQLFTGSFVHNNLNQALEAIFLTMDISYSYSGENKELKLLN